MSQRMWFFISILGIELLLGCYCYVSGPHGLRETMALRRTYEQVSCACAQLMKKIQVVQQDIIDWEQDPAYREIYAREHLHMGSPQETWYRY